MFEVRITETKEVRKLCDPEWKLVGKEADAKYGYTPAIERTVAVTTDILKQSVEKLNIEAVIKAINNIK